MKGQTGRPCGAMVAQFQPDVIGAPRGSAGSKTERPLRVKSRRSAFGGSVAAECGPWPCGERSRSILARRGPQTAAHRRTRVTVQWSIAGRHALMAGGPAAADHLIGAKRPWFPRYRAPDGWNLQYGALRPAPPTTACFLTVAAGAIRARRGVGGRDVSQGARRRRHGAYLASFFSTPGERTRRFPIWRGCKSNGGAAGEKIAPAYEKLTNQQQQRTERQLARRSHGHETAPAVTGVFGSRQRIRSQKRRFRENYDLVTTGGIHGQARSASYPGARENRFPRFAAPKI